MKVDDIKYNLAAAYRIMAYLAMDDHTYTHLSARPVNADFYYIYPFGFRFEEVTPDNLLKVSLDGAVLEGNEYQYNKTGYFIHGNIYKARPDISSIFHFHTPASVAVSSMKCGLLPISQWALHFYEKVSYHNYDSLVLDNNQSTALVTDLEQNYVMFLRNHGVITCGKTIHEAMFYSYHLELACKTQCLSYRVGQELITPSKEICQQTVKDILAFEKDLGKRDWEAWLRMIKKLPDSF
jgi:ribulose-5-phosphate 4-epimerase/fuculose-1-phosphate aldolase